MEDLMEPCPRLSHLQLDDRSRAGIERLRDIEQLGELLAIGVGINPLLDIFSRPFEASYNIATYDWGIWSAAMSAVPEIIRERVRVEAGLQIIDHNHDPKQQRFWRAIEAGCRLQALQLPSARPAIPTPAPALTPSHVARSSRLG
jgi:hypothetical protein